MKLGGMILISLEGCERMVCLFMSCDRKEVKTRENWGGEGQRNVRQT